MALPPTYLTIGQTAERCGVTTATLRFYEEKGLINAERGAGNQRVFHRAILRRVSIIRIARTLGFSLSEIRDTLETLPPDRTPSRSDWQRLSRQWRGELEHRIEGMRRLRDQLDSCIGCGCLSLDSCALYNPADSVAREGSGPRLLMRGGTGGTRRA